MTPSNSKAKMFTFNVNIVVTGCDNPVDAFKKMCSQIIKGDPPYPIWTSEGFVGPDGEVFGEAFSRWFMENGDRLLPEPGEWIKEPKEN